MGPLLLLIYINDIKFSTNFYNFIQYADDTNLFNSMANIADDNNEVLNVELDKIFQWLCANKLSVNIKKTKYILFHNLHKNIENIKLDLKLNNTLIERVNKFNFLGVTLDEHLNWKCTLRILL